MPADRCAWGIFGNDSFHQRIGRQPGKLRGSRLNVLKKIREGLRRRCLACAEIVFEAEFHDATFRRVSMEIKILKCERADCLKEISFFLPGQKVGLIDKSFRQLRKRKKRA